jgi:DNA-binding MarR family transcriptional regulator
MTTQTPPLTGQDINLAARAVRDLLDVLLERAGLTFEQSLVLQALGPETNGLDRQGLVTDLAKRLRVDPSEVSTTVVSLAHAGLLVESPERVRLTPDGQSTYDGMQSGIRRVTARLYGPFAPDDLATTRRVLREIIERAPVVGAEL